MARFVKGAAKAKGRTGHVKSPKAGKKPAASFTKKAKASRGNIEYKQARDTRKEPVVSNNQADVALNKLIGNTGQ